MAWVKERPCFAKAARLGVLRSLFCVEGAQSRRKASARTMIAFGWAIAVSSIGSVTPWVNRDVEGRLAGLYFGGTELRNSVGCKVFLLLISTGVLDRLPAVFLRPSRAVFVGCRLSHVFRGKAWNMFIDEGEEALCLYCLAGGIHCEG